MKRPEICAVIVDTDLDSLNKVERIVDLFEVRIDLIGSGWPQVIEKLHKPWIASNRTTADGGKWRGSEEKRISELIKAAEMGAVIIDIELGAKGLECIRPMIKNKAKLLISFHDWESTQSPKNLSKIVQRQLAEGADICKIVTTARKFEDNITVLKLIASFPAAKVVSFAMGEAGIISRILSPLAGGYFTYASIKEGSESAPGQITAEEMRSIYRRIKL
jgi:3-dehydroquinate dehydratase type I